MKKFIAIEKKTHLVNDLHILFKKMKNLCTNLFYYKLKILQFFFLKKDL